MRIVVVGRAQEVRGFALAGVETAVCRQAGDVPGLLDVLGSRPAGVGLVLISGWAAAAGRAAIASLSAQQGPPVVLALPGAGERED